MSIAKKLISRAGGEYKSAAPWAYRYRSAIAQLKTMGTQAAGTLTLTASRTSCFKDGNVFFKTSTTMPTTNYWYNDIVFMYDYDDPDSVFYNMDARSETDLLGKSAGFSMGFDGSHVWENTGTYTVKCFAFNTSNNTWDEASVSVTVTDPLLSIPSTARYLVASDGDFTGAPAASFTYTNMTTALNAFLANTTAGCMLLVKGGDTLTMLAAPTIRPNSATTHYVVGTFGPSVKPKIITDFGGSPFGNEVDVFSLRKCASFTMSNIFWRGLYNSKDTPQMVEGELVAAGYAGGTDTSTDVQILYSGWGGSLEELVQCNHVTMYNCKVQGVSKAVYSRTGAYHAVVNCHISEWADYAVLHSYSTDFAYNGNNARVEEDCVHLGGSKIYTARPREVFHGPLRSEKSRGLVCNQNDVFTKNGWFSANTCQPPLRFHSDGASNGGQLPRFCCSQNYSQGGDAPLIFNPANPTIPSSMTEAAVIESNILEGTKFQYGGAQTAHAAVIRNNILLQPDVPRVSPNNLWQSLSFFKNNGESNGTDPAVFDQPAFAYSNTLVNELQTQGAFNPYGAITNNPSGVGAVAGVAFTNLTLSNNLGYAPNLAVTSVNKVNPSFDDTYNPSTIGFVNTGTAQLGNVLDIYCNIRHATTPNLGAVEATTTI
jgi:hypothetical protein